MKSYTYYEVIVPVTQIQSLTYKSLNADLEIGSRVVVPFLNRYSLGIVSKKSSQKPSFQCKDILESLDLQPLFSPNYIQLLEWMQNYYLYSIGDFLKNIIPSQFFIHSDCTFNYRNPVSSAHFFKTKHELQAFQIIETEQTIKYSQLKKIMKPIPSYVFFLRLEKSEFITMIPETEHYGKEKTVVIYEVDFDQIEQWDNDTFAKKTPAQYRILKTLTKHQQGLSLKELGTHHSLIRTLLNKELIIQKTRKIERDATTNYSYDKDVPVHEMSEDQQKCYERISHVIDEKKFQAFLLYGVTGSGKTEVYIRLAQKILAQNKSVILLVPEIALTPKLTFLFKKRLQGKVEVLHSKISQGEKFDAWTRIFKAENCVVIGARSAIFAPVKNPGLIIVDEEHEQNYKQSGQRPYYHARDIAVKRASLEKIPVILGSATPSIESWYNAQIVKYELLQLPKRINQNPLPEVILFDLCNKKNSMVQNFMSHELYYMIKQRLERKEQVILFMNRRGYAPFLICTHCGYKFICPSCDIAMTYHKSSHQMICHYCDKTLYPDEQCPECKKDTMQPQGLGLERINEDLHKIFPEAKMIRMDQDTVKGKDAHYKILKQFEEGKYDILIGTQMITKGLDFHNVTLVGVLLADIGLYLPDFRAGEKTFQLMTQVTGRTGRGEKKGVALIQTYSSEHYSIQKSLQQDYEKFAEIELQNRKTLNYPPYRRIILIRLVSKNEKLLTQVSESIKDTLIENCPKETAEILGPTPAPLFKMNQFYRYQILIKTVSVLKINQLYQTIIKKTKFPREIDIQYDVDPAQML